MTDNMGKEELIKCLEQAINLLDEERNRISNSGFNNTYCEIEIAKRDGGIAALSALKYVLTH